MFTSGATMYPDQYQRQRCTDVGQYIEKQDDGTLSPQRRRFLRDEADRIRALLLGAHGRLDSECQ